MGDNLRLGYKTKYPLDMVISEQCIDKYNSIFFFLMKIKRINHVLATLWKFLSSHEFRVRQFIYIIMLILPETKQRWRICQNKKGSIIKE